MSKTFKILLGVILSISVIGVGAWLYITSTPEYALHKTHEDIEERGLEALKDHVTDTLKKEIELVEGISGNAFVKMIVGAAVSDDVAEAVVSEFKQIEWTRDDVIRSQKQAQVILRFRYKDKLSGTIPIKMIKENREWKISGIGFPSLNS
ncbi:MAG: hypothetical protein IKS37_07635 [Solobacterium sp.]|nr:hypothetical protein [Solobacterium sp.]